MQPGSATRVVLARVAFGCCEDDVRAAVRAAAESTTDFSWLSKGDSVFIKPALNSGIPYPRTTSPIAVGAMVELLKEKGAGRVVVGDMSGIEHVKLSLDMLDELRGSSRSLMEATGMSAAVQEANGETHFFEEAGWEAFHEETPRSGFHWDKGIMMPDILKQVDHIILMPRCSRHALTGNSLGLKAVVGYWRTDSRVECHQNARTMYEKIAEANTVETLMEKQRLVLSAADAVLATFGPDFGHPLWPDNGLIIASESVVAHDMISLAWLLENRHQMSPFWKLYVDPCIWKWSVNLGNRYIVYRLNGIKAALCSQNLPRNNARTIWHDRILNHAYRVFGGRPVVAVVAADQTVPADLKNRLTEMTTHPGD